MSVPNRCYAMHIVITLCFFVVEIYKGGVCRKRFYDPRRRVNAEGRETTEMGFSFSLI